MAIPEDLWRVPLRVLLTVAVSLLVYVCWKCAFASFQVFQELFVMATICAGHAWSPDGKSMRMHPYFCQTSKLDDYVVDECYRFHTAAFDTVMSMEMEKKKKAYRRALMSYSHILLCRDREDGSLRATIFVGVDRKKSYTMVKIGMMLCHAQYRGGPWMKLATALLIIRELCLHPLTPLYMLGKASTYKAYIQLYENNEFYPRYEKETPELYKKIAEEYAMGMKNSSEDYDRDNLILRRRLSIVREGVASITERELQDPRIRFFSERNHDWREGDQMILVLRLLWSDLLRQLVQIFKYSLLLKKKPKYSDTLHAKRGTKRRPQLKRGMTFQDATANLYTDQFSVYEFAESGETTGTSLSNHPLSTTPKSPLGKTFVFKGERSTAVGEELEYDINFPF